MENDVALYKRLDDSIVERLKLMKGKKGGVPML